MFYDSLLDMTMNYLIMKIGISFLCSFISYDHQCLLVTSDLYIYVDGAYSF